MIIRESELMHYGVLGMKWGQHKVNRYAIKGGSYTQSGIKRYEKSKAKYQKSLENYKDTKKKDSVTRTQKRELKVNKNRMKKEYKHLKLDYKADKGKELYAKGYRISDNKATRLIGAAATIATGAQYAKNMNILTKEQANSISALASGAVLIGTGYKVCNKYKDSNLRAYYGHTSKY